MFPKIGGPQNGRFIMEIPIKMDDLGVPPFSETPTLIPCLGHTWILRDLFDAFPIHNFFQDLRTKYDAMMLGLSRGGDVLWWLKSQDVMVLYIRGVP